MPIDVDLKPVSINFTLKDHIYEVLRTSILQIDIYDSEQDMRLDERKLAEQLGISRTPIREALARLYLSTLFRPGVCSSTANQNNRSRYGVRMGGA